MFHDLIRLFAYLNLALALIALIVGPVMISMSFALAKQQGEWGEEASQGMALGVGVSVYFALLLASAVGLLRHKRWAKSYTLGLSGLMLAQAVWHGIQGEWSVIPFLVAYALLAGWLLLHPINRTYFPPPGAA